MANRNCDGTNDNIDCGANASIGTFTQMSVGFYLYATTLTNNGTLASKGTTQVGGGWNLLCDASGSPRKLQLIRTWSGGLGNWSGTGLSDATRHHCVVTYDGGATTNDPIFYIDGLVVTTVQSGGDPSGTITDDAANPLRLAESGDGSGDSAQNNTHFFYYSGILTAEEVNRARWWGRPRGGVQVYHPFVTDKVANEGAATADATITGATMTNAFCPPVQRPGMGTAL